MARHCDPAREKCGVIPSRYPDRMYLFMGFSLVTILSRMPEKLLRYPAGRNSSDNGGYFQRAFRGCGQIGYC